ncbi:MAG TPA: methyltransferase domain-containing protein [Streptosporangiaceae bacterium]|nr:methyltransferase domain-containing protein [Streptosporangiaceae bacterium]
MTPDEDSARRLAELTRRWRDDLTAWAIPDHITAAVTQSPWVLPTQVFARRADHLSSQPAGVSFDRAWAALDPPGTVLDIGSGAGAASLPLAPRTTELTAVDASEPMLDLLAERAAARGLTLRRVHGTWPDISGEVPVADVVTCHHVLYNVADIGPFVAALTAHARRLVVVETTVTHPLVSLNDLWLKFHGLVRPQGPTGADILAILAASGIECRSQTWRRPGGPDYPSMAELVDVTRRRLCLPPERAADVEAALIEAGVDPVRPADLGSSGRDVLTIWWRGGGQDLGHDGPADLAARASCCRDDEITVTRG